MLNVISFVLEFIVVYFIIGLLAMWLVESVLYKATVKRGAMTKALSDYYNYFLDLPLSHQLVIFGLCWPVYFPKLISTVMFVLL